MRISDWSSDVCSSDLAQCRFGQAETGFALDGHGGGDRDGRSRLAVDPEVEADRRQFLERYILGQTVYHVKKTGRIVERAGLRQRIDDLVQVARRQMEVPAPAAGQLPVPLLGLLGRVRNRSEERRGGQ